MGIIRSFFIFSTFILIISILIGKSVDLHYYDENIFGLVYGVFSAVSEMDMFLKIFRINGFYRGFESVVSSYQFYKCNQSGIYIDMKTFDGVQVMLFTPKKREKGGPGVVYLHGGGWTQFNPRIYCPFIAELARKLGVVIAAVDYRKAPEHRYPAGLNDAVAATRYFLSNGERFDVNPARVALMGDSAGGNLALAVSYRLVSIANNNKNYLLPKLLALLNPALQIGDFNTPSLRDSASGATVDLMINRPKITKYYCMYAFGQLGRSELADCQNTLSTNGHLTESVLQTVGPHVDWSRYLTGRGYNNRPKSSFNHPSASNRYRDRFSQLVIDPGFSPLTALNNNQLSKLPPVFAVLGTLDPLRDDSKILVARLSGLRAFGASYIEYEGSHNMFVAPSYGLRLGERAFDTVIEIFQRNAVL